MSDKPAADPLELPTAELRDAAFRLYGETSEVRSEKLDEMRRKIEGLPEGDRLSDLSDRSLIRFLRGRKFDVGRAVSSAVNMAHFYRDHPQWTQGLEEEDFSVCAPWIQLLEQRTPEGSVILILRLIHGINSTDLEEFKKSPLKLVRWNIWFLTHLTFNLYVQVFGLVVINAFGDMTSDDTKRLRSLLNVNERIQVFRFIANCCPFKLKGLYVFDEPVIFRWLWGIISVFMSPKLRERFHVCGKNYAAIKEVVPDNSILPLCMDGGIADDTFAWKASHERIKLEFF